MKLEKLFKKLESFFNMDKKEQQEQKDKKDELSVLLNEKIKNKKERISSCKNDEKKAKLKDELEMLKKIIEQYDM